MVAPFDATTHSTDRPPSNVPEAIAQLDQAEAAVDRALGGPSGGESPRQAGEAQAAPTSMPASKSPPAEAAGAATSDSAGAPASAPDPCLTACRALESMGRSVEHVCGLAGEQADECTRARDRVGRATARVHAHCPACS